MKSEVMLLKLKWPSAHLELRTGSQGIDLIMKSDGMEALKGFQKEVRRSKRKRRRASRPSKPYKYQGLGSMEPSNHSNNYDFVDFSQVKIT